MIISLVGQKGGSGKSTLAVAIAAELFARQYNVLLVDADPQATARTWGDVAAETGRAIPTIVAMGANMHQPRQLPQLSRAYDVTVIDTPGRDGRTQRSALLVSDLALVPCGPSAADAWAMAESKEVIEEAQTINGDLRAHVVITRVVKQTVIGTQARENLQSLGLPMFDTALGFRVAFQEFLASGQGMGEYAPRDAAAKEVRGLTDEVSAVLGLAPTVTSTAAEVA